MKSVDANAINHVSDTARYVALLRAQESDRPDALFRDPWARRLAGYPAEAMVQKFSSPRFDSRIMAVRTKILDDLVLSLVRENKLDTVLNLGSGLDTRVFRLELPSSLRWVEADLPRMIAYKRDLLKGETPPCEWETKAVDLSESQARKDFFKEIQIKSQRTLVITEGLLMYLTDIQVQQLADDLLHTPSVQFWLTDLLTPQQLRWVKKRMGDFAKTNVHFAPPEGPEYFRHLGWKPLAFRSFADEARRLHRESNWYRYGRLFSPLLPKWWEGERQNGIALLGRLHPGTL